LTGEGRGSGGVKLLITGTNGFIGRNLKERFQGRHELHCPLRGELDLRDAEAVREYLAGRGFDAVIHCAVNVLSSEDTLKMHFSLERCSDAYGKLLSVGSAAEYDLRHYVPMMTEDYFGEHLPADVYGFAKHVIAKDIECRPRNLYNLRVFGIYGKHENHRRRFISNNICRALCDRDLSIQRNMYFDYLYIDDFARIVELFLAREPRQRTYNVCTGQRVDLLTLAGIIRAVDGRERPIVVREEGFKPEYTGDNSRFLREFGPFEFTPHERAIGELYRWYRDPANITLDPDDCR
jgi:UDP-glucose 4-epimerase